MASDMKISERLKKKIELAREIDSAITIARKRKDKVREKEFVHMFKDNLKDIDKLLAEIYRSYKEKCAEENMNKFEK